MTTPLPATDGHENASPRRALREPVDFRGRHVHFVGIGGCGMSGLALMLQRRGAIITGSDQSDGEAIARLDHAGIPVRVGPAMHSLPEGTELVVHSAAIKGDHPEIRFANTRAVPTITYAEALGDAQTGSTAVSIAGTHGKSTTTAMTSWVGIHCGLDPSVIVGATCDQLGGGSRTGATAIPTGMLAGKPGVLVCEACEFNRSFHHHRPTIGLVNNIEEDHLDYYANLAEIIHSFHEFARILPPASAGGKLLIAEDGAHRREVTAGLDCEVATFGFSPEADYQVVYDAPVNRVCVMWKGYVLAAWTNQMPGSHNALNSAAAGIINSWLGADWDDIAVALEKFGGLDRRSQELGQRRLGKGAPVRVFDDYGHHPTECEKTLKALRTSEQPTRLICVFEPHQHSRTRFLLDQFAACFTQADEVIVPHIYFVRDSEVEKTRVSAQDLVDRLEARGTTARHIGSFDEIVEHLELHCRPGDLVVTMGAGPVNRIAKDFLRRGGADTTLTRAGEAAIPGFRHAFPSGTSEAVA
ncbi:MAG: UDP-N-acetylmuramate--L-alanine ligase [Planctomycetaceae bacterium]|nr:UDP-N-acetylmuramate--L-alanine ligase [Planctomycetaceae bacterium]